MKITLSDKGEQGSQKSIIIDGKEVSAEDMEKLNLSGMVGNISILNGNDSGENTIIIHSQKSSLNNWQQQVKALSDSIRAEVAVTKEGKELSPEAMARIEALSARISANADSITRALEEKGINALSAQAIAKADSLMVYTRQIPAIIYVIDGKRASEKEFNKLDPNDIASITVLKGKEAKKKYGTKENDKVLLITTKKKK